MMAAERKILLERMTDWHRKGHLPMSECPDAPEIITILQSVGFKLTSINFDSTNNEFERCKVTINCGRSGVKAELISPETVFCRCTRFIKEDITPLDLKDKASCWQVTASHENLHKPSFGSSILPEITPERLIVFGEAIKLLMDEFDKGKKKTIENLSLSTTNLSNKTPAILPDSSVFVSRRASVGCCEELKEQKENISTVTTTSIKATSELNVTFSTSSPTTNENLSNIRDIIENMVKLGNNALNMLPGGNKSQQRKSSLLPHQENVLLETERKKARMSAVISRYSTDNSTFKTPSINKPPIPMSRSDVKRRSLGSPGIHRDTPIPSVPRVSSLRNRLDSNPNNTSTNTAAASSPKSKSTVFERLSMKPSRKSSLPKL